MRVIIVSSFGAVFRIPQCVLVQDMAARFVLKYDSVVDVLIVIFELVAIAISCYCLLQVRIQHDSGMLDEILNLKPRLESIDHTYAYDELYVDDVDDDVCGEDNSDDDSNSHQKTKSTTLANRSKRPKHSSAPAFRKTRRPTAKQAESAEFYDTLSKQTDALCYNGSEGKLTHTLTFQRPPTVATQYVPARPSQQYTENDNTIGIFKNEPVFKLQLSA